MADKASMCETANAPKLPDEKTLEVTSSIAARKLAKSCRESLDDTHLRNGESHTQTERQERIQQKQQRNHHQSPSLSREKHKQSGRVLSSEKSKKLCAQQSEDYGP